MQFLSFSSIFCKFAVVITLFIHTMVIETFKATMFSGTETVFSSLSFMSQPGHPVAVSSRDSRVMALLVSALAGITPLSEGWICIDGEPLLPQTAAYMRRYIACVPSFMNFGNEKACDYLCSERPQNACHPARNELESEMALLGVDSKYLDMCFSDIPQKELQRMLVAHAGAKGSPIVLLDNPTSCQDMEGRRLLAAYLSSPRFSDRSVVVATADDTILAVCGRVVEL